MLEQLLLCLRTQSDVARRFTYTTLLAIASSIGAVAQSSNNLLVIVADDLGVDYVTAYREGSAPAPTPNIDALAKRGVLFRNAWANPSCSPTRASLMTGRYPFRTLVGRWIRYPNNSEPIGTLSDREWTLPEVLDRAKSGYAHACVGKWHINDVREGLLTPTKRAGWSHFTGTMWGQIPSYTRWPRVANGRESTSTKYATTQMTDDALAWIKAQSKPWVCYLTYCAPHLPLHAPPSHLHTQKLSGLSPSRQPRPFYRAMIEAMDTEMGRLFKALGSELAHTNVIFIGDNGSVQRMAVAPFDGNRAKGTPYEGGLNVPLIVAGPDVKSGGREVKALTSAVDVFATALDLCKAKSGLPSWVANDSVSLVPYLTNPAQKPLRKFVYSEQFTGAKWPRPNQNGHSVIRDERYKLIYWRSRSHEFYDLAADPWERTNLLRRTLNSQERQAHTALVNEIGRLRTPQARFVPFGSNRCAGAAGTPTISARGRPILGGSFDVTLSRVTAQRPALLALGFSSTHWGALPLPLDLRPFGGANGCMLGSSGEILIPMISSAQGTASLKLQIPFAPELTDHAFFVAWLVAEARNLVSTQSAACVLGR